MRSADKANNTNPKAPQPQYLVETKVVVSLGDNAYLLNDGRAARQALSCLVQPEIDDQVLVASSENGSCFVVHILHRKNNQVANLSVPGAEQLCINQAQVSVTAKDNIALNCLTNIDINAATGVLRLNASNLFTTVSESLVQNVRYFIGQSEQYLVDAKQLLKLHGQQALVTADKDIKVDAERISMG